MDGQAHREGRKEKDREVGRKRKVYKVKKAEGV